MDMSTPELPWGYREGIPNPAPKALWGCRAIAIRGRTRAGYQSSTITSLDILWDRNGVVGEEPAAEELRKRLTAGRIKAARKAIKAAYVAPLDNQHIVLVDDKYMTMVGNPRASGGYVYITAWLKEHE